MPHIIAAARTPIGKMLGSLSSLNAADLGAVAIREAVARSGLEVERIDEVIMGNVLSAGVGQAPARQAALRADVPDSVPSMTINKVCGSGLKAVMLADQAIRASDARVVVAGGMENMSRAPHLLAGTRGGWKFGNQQAIDSMLHDGLWCAHEDVVMGNLADYTASQQGVSRADQDTYSVQSHQRAAAAWRSGKFAAEVVAVDVARGKNTTTIARDEGPRDETNLELLASLRPAFAADGTATAGNASQISDGAATVVVVDDALATETAGELSARIVASATSGGPPKDLFIAPVTAVQKVLAKVNLTAADIDLFEINEAFASQSLACIRMLDLDEEKVNVHGGAIALGHPIGASGARVLVTLLYALRDRGLQRGLATLCLGGGNAVAMIIELNS